MYIFLIIVHVIACIVLIFVILLQAGRGGGLSESFGVSSTSSFFGTSAARFLQRATAICAITFLLTSLTLAALSTRRTRSLIDMHREPEGVEAESEAKVDAEAVEETVGEEAPEAADVVEEAKEMFKEVRETAEEVVETTPEAPVPAP